MYFNVNLIGCGYMRKVWQQFIRTFLFYCQIKCVSATCRFSPAFLCRIVNIPADDGPDPANLSLSERIKLFNIKMSEQRMMQKREAPRRRLSRFQTQPITPDEVESAKCIPPPHVALGVFLFLSSSFFFFHFNFVSRLYVMNMKSIGW